MVVGFSEFGSDDVELYRQYLFAVVLNGLCGDSLGWRQGADDCDVAVVAGGGCAEQSRLSIACPPAVRAVLQGAFDGGGDERGHSFTGGGSGLVGQLGSAGVDSEGTCGRRTCAGGSQCSGQCCERGSGGDVAAADGATGASGVTGRKPVAVERGVQSGGTGGGARLPGQLKRGPNYARNQASRERKKQAKASRRGAEVASREAGRKGFFSGCDEALQQELRDSRARMLILENQRKAAQYARDVARMQSPVQLALDAVDLVRKTHAESKGADPRVMGWARTVVSAEVESLAKSAPNSVPSLESISLSESGDGRASEYKRRYEELTLLYDSADYYNPEDRADEFKMLQAEFADVVKGDVEAANRYKFARELRVAIAEAAVNGEYACSRAVEAYLDAAENIADD